MAINLDSAYEEFTALKRDNMHRNYQYHLLREAVRGNFRWPADWPAHIPMVKHNLCRAITERFSAFMMGKGFTWNINRPNTLEYRDQAERAEKILTKLLSLSHSELQFNMGSKVGSELGRTIYKVYKKGEAGKQHACFDLCQPDYFYGVPSKDGALDEWSTVYYSYPMDRLTAIESFGQHDYKTELESDAQQMYDMHRKRNYTAIQRRTVPVLEIWNRKEYALVVGGVTIYNGDTPPEYHWSEDGKGFIPFVVIENVRNAGDGWGEADIAQARELNEHLNYVLSRKQYLVGRWLQPTLVWEGAPQNYGEILRQTLGGGGAIPARLGAKLYFLAYDRPNQAVQEIEQTLRSAIIETSGLSEIAMNGVVSGTVNTGPALQARFQPVLSTVESKRMEWDHGLGTLFAMLLQVQEVIGDSDALGEAVINETSKSQNYGDGKLIKLTGKDINGLRDVSIAWPGILPKDDLQTAQFEAAKAQQGLQSIYTTLEKLGEEYPDDEIARIRMENQDPALRGQAVAEQVRANAQGLGAQAAAASTYHDISQGQQDQQPGATPPPDQGAPAAPPEPNPQDVGSRLRTLARNAHPQLDQENATLPAGVPVGY